MPTIARFTAATIALVGLVGCSGDSPPRVESTTVSTAPQEVPRTAGSTTPQASIASFCTLLGEVDAAFATIDSSNADFPERQRAYADIGVLVDQAKASVSAVEPQRRAAVQSVLDFADQLVSAVVDAADQAEAEASMFEGPDAVFAKETPFESDGVAWIAENCGIDVAGEESAEPPTTASITEVPASDPSFDGAPIPVVLDYSPTMSDVAALLYLTQHPRVDLLAVTIAGTGESHCEPAIANTRALLTLGGEPDVPVACGTTQPLAGGEPWPEEWREAADLLAGLDLESAIAESPTQVDGAATAIELLTEVVTATDGVPFVVIALAPLTNIAEGISQIPGLAPAISQIYAMGGAVGVAGNAPDAAAEWNFAADPEAAAQVFRSDVPITLVPLDATNDVPVEEPWFASLAGALTADPAAVAATAVHDMFAAGRPWDTGFYFWDELTAAIAVDESLTDFATAALVVDDSGATIVSPTGTDVRVAETPARDRFERHLLVTLLNGADG